MELLAYRDSFCFASLGFRVRKFACGALRCLVDGFVILEVFGDCGRNDGIMSRFVVLIL